MNAVGRVSLTESWPLYEKERHFELGSLLSCAVTDMASPAQIGQLGLSHAGCWECDLSDESRLFWSGGVYDIFGLPREAKVARNDAIRFYAEHSRVAMERLRDHAIRHKQGFTLDAEICPAIGEARWMRLIAAPVCAEGKAVRLHGIKLII